MRRALAVVLGGTCVSCTLLVSTSGLVGDGASPTPAGDAAIEADAAPPPPPDGEAGDAPADGGSVLGCEGPNVVLCDDFERETGLGPWAQTNTSPDGTVGTTTADARRGLRSLRAFTAGSSDVGAALYGIPQGRKANKRIEARFALRVLGAASAGTIGQVNTISIRNGTDYVNVYVHVQDYGIHLAEQAFPNGAAAQYAQHEVFQIVQGGPWRDVVVSITVGPPSRLRVTVDGVQAFEGPSDIAIPAGTVGAVVGIGYQGAHPRSEVLVDDYVLTVE